MMTTGAQAITTIHLAILAILALLAVAGIVWGTRLRRRRRAGIERRIEHQAEIDAAPAVNTAPRQQQAQAHAPAPATDAATPDRPAPAPVPAETRTDTDTDTEISNVVHIGTGTDTGETADSPSPADQPLTILKGLGPKLAVRLGELGMTTVGDIAALDPAAAAALDAQLGAFTGRMTRDRWIEQARLLAAGDRAGFEAVFGRL